MYKRKRIFQNNHMGKDKWFPGAFRVRLSKMAGNLSTEWIPLKYIQNDGCSAADQNSQCYEISKVPKCIFIPLQLG